MLVRDVMTSPVITVGPDTPLKTAAKELTNGGFTALPVVANGLLVGVVTEADLVRAHTVPPTIVGAVMTTEVITTTPLIDVADVVALMISKRIRSVLVLNGKRLVGIVSRRDVLATITDSDAAIAAVVRRTVETSGSPERWGIEVSHGVVRLRDHCDDDADRQNARTLVSAIPGVLDVEIVAVRS
jgi:CBS domain-containing protein